MSLKAQFVRGEPLTVPYVPSGADVAAGDVVVTGAVVGVAHQKIIDGETGSLAVGNGTYLMTGDAAITAGKKVWWNAAAGKVTETASTHKVFGFVSPGSSCSGDGATCEVVLAPEI